MNLSKEDFELTIRKSLRTNQYIVFSAIAISLTVFFMDTDNVFWSMLFLLIGSISLFTINNCKADRKHYDSGQLTSSKGTLVDIFPEDKNGKRWILFVQEEATGKIVEVSSIIKPDVQLQKEYQILYTPKLNILVKII